MKLKRVEVMKSVTEKLGWFKSQIELENEINFYDNNIGSEDFMCGLLNYVYGWHLVNLNKKDKNCPGIDLGDEENRVAVQITSDNSRKKVQSTIDTFLKKEYEKKYSKLIFVILGSKTRFSKDFDTANKFVFDRIKDVIDINQIIKDLDNCDDEMIFQVHSYIEEKMRVPDKSKNYNDINSLLLETREKIHAMCLTKLRALGISRDIGELIIEDGISTELPDFIKQKGVKFLIGDFGSGKSHLLYQNTLKLVDSYQKRDIDKIPVFLEASDINKYGSISDYCKIIDIDIECAFIIIDSLDEGDYDLIEKIVNEVEFLENRYDDINIIVGSRPISFLIGKKNIHMPLLSDGEINGLYTRITGDSSFSIEHRFDGKEKKRMLTMIRKPFFAILYAIYMKDHHFYMKNEVDMINYFIEKSMQPYLLKNPQINLDFEKMSALSIERNYGIIHKSEIPRDINLDALIKSGFVRLEEAGSIVFNLPIIVQWLGARAIRDNLVDFFELVDDESRLLKWRYSLSIMFNQMTYEESEKYFSYLVENKVDLAGIIIRDGIAFEGIIDVSDTIESGKKMYRCMQSWVKGLGVLAESLGVSKNGTVNTLAILCKEQWIEFSWANEYAGNNIILLKDAVKFQCFSTVHGRGVPAQATWPWVVTFEYLSELIEDGIENKKWITLNGTVESEFVWKNTLKLKNKGSLYTGSFDINDVNEYRKKALNYKKIDMNTYFYLVDRLKEGGNNRIEVPYVAGDQEYKTNFIWANYSKEQMRRRVEAIYKNVFREYQKMAETFFECFKMRLSTYLLLPCKFVGTLVYDDSETEPLYAGPIMQYYMEPLPLEKENVVEIKLSDDRKNFGCEVEDVFKIIMEAADNYRSGKKEFISFIIHTGVCMDSSCTPVTDIVYDMLKNDLKKIAWIKK